MIRIGIQIESSGMVMNHRCNPLPLTDSAVPSAIPSSSTGKAQITSIAREMTASIQPR